MWLAEPQVFAVWLFTESFLSPSLHYIPETLLRLVPSSGVFKGLGEASLERPQLEAATSSLQGENGYFMP